MIFPSVSVLSTLIFITTLLFTFTSPTNASEVDAQTHRQLAQRMIKKRAGPLDIFDNGTDPGTTTTPSQFTSVTLISPPLSVTLSRSTSSGLSSVSDNNLLGISFGTSASSSAALTSSSLSPSSSALMSSTIATSTSSLSLSAPSTSTPAPQTTQTPSPSLAEFSTATSTITSVSASETTKVTGATSKKIPRTMLTVIIIVASSVSAIAIIWTIIRKWKFSPSSGFGNRMQPIDWTPAAEHSESRLHRTPSNASHSSIHSGSEHTGLDRSHSRYNAGLVADLPAHDFTAGPTQLGSYADLRRGTSQAPQMFQTISRGPSLNRGYAF